MYKAVEESLNIPAVWLLNKIGLNKGIESAEKFGIPVKKVDKNLALALGGMYNGVSPLQMANAFSAFPNGGKREDSHFITKIVGPTGNILAEHDPETTKVTSKSVANEMTSMLMNVVETGTGRRAHIPGYDIAGKTGSTQLPYKDINGTKDQWMVGYTPNLVGAIWIGFDQTDRTHYLPNNSSGNVVPIFRAMMDESLPYIKKKKFEVESVNTQLANKGQTAEEARKAFQKKADQIRKELEDNAGKLGKKLKEEAPKWKQELNNGMQGLGRTIDDIIRKVQGQ
jgi:penicillin-binding protein 2A